jgi:hypothetical protein
MAMQSKMLCDHCCFKPSDAALQSVTQTLTANVVFTTTLNSGGEFGASAIDGDARYLGIAVACPSGSYTALTTRQALTPASWALPGLYSQPQEVKHA